MKNIGVVVQDTRARVLGTNEVANAVARGHEVANEVANEVAPGANKRDYDSGLGESGIVATGIGFGDSLRIAVS